MILRQYKLSCEKERLRYDIYLFEYAGNLILWITILYDIWIQNFSQHTGSRSPRSSWGIQGSRFTCHSPRSVFHNPRSTVHGPRATVYGPRFKVHGHVILILYVNIWKFYFLYIYTYVDIAERLSGWGTERQSDWAAERLISWSAEEITIERLETIRRYLRIRLEHLEGLGLATGTFKILCTHYLLALPIGNQRNA